MSELTHIVVNWMKDHPEFYHYSIDKYIYTWIECDCVDGALKFIIRKDAICMFHRGQGSTTLQAADPSFFDDLHTLLVDECAIAKAYIKSNATIS